MARLRHIEPPVALSGHGPHALMFDRTQALDWRESRPAATIPALPISGHSLCRDQPRVTLTLIAGDGMTASLQPDTPDPGTQPLGRVLAGTKFVADLPAGRYRVAALSLGRDDRLAYTISLHADELQPATPRRVTLPADANFTIATSRVVTLTSFGGVPLRAELRDDSGHVLARASGRTDDWNVALSRFLPAGRYTLGLATLKPPPGKATSSSDDDATGTPDQPSGDDTDMNSNDDTGTDTSNTDRPADDSANSDQANSDPPDGDKPAAAHGANPFVARGRTRRGSDRTWFDDAFWRRRSTCPAACHARGRFASWWPPRRRSN